MIANMAEIADSFAARVRSELAKRGMSEADLARHTGIAPTVVARILKGKEAPSLRHFAAIACELGSDLREYIGAELRHELRAARVRIEQAERDRATEVDARQKVEADAALRCAELEQRLTEAECNLAAEADARRKAEVDAAAKCAELEQRVQQAATKRNRAAKRQNAGAEMTARCVELEQRAKQAELDRAAEVDARRKVEADAAVKSGRLEQRVKQAEAAVARAERARAVAIKATQQAAAGAAQAERDRTAEAKAHRKAMTDAMAKCTKLKQRAEQAEAKCTRLEQAERERSAEADVTWDFEPGFAHPGSVVIDDRYAHARSQADLLGKIFGKVVEKGVSAFAFHRLSRRDDMR